MESVMFVDVDTTFMAGTKRCFNWDDVVTLKESLGDGISEAEYSWRADDFMLKGHDFVKLNAECYRFLAEVQRYVTDGHNLRVVAATRTASSLEDICELLDNLRGYEGIEFRELLRFSGGLGDAVTEWLGGRAAKVEDYLVFTREELPYLLRGHSFRFSVQLSPHGWSWSRNSVLMAGRTLLEHSPWYEWNNEGSVRSYEDAYDPYGADRYKKVILLDIDGVLNDEGPARSAGTIVDPQMVDALARVVSETDAQIILTSSWKYAYQRFAREGFVSSRTELNELQSQLDRCGLVIAGMTPLTAASGPIARPAEIMEWLRRYWRTEAFVILEDDTFWEWGWLRNSVVTTLTLCDDSEDNEEPRPYRWRKYAKGMTEEHADLAISMLNRKGNVPECDS